MKNERGNIFIIILFIIVVIFLIALCFSSGDSSSSKEKRDFESQLRKDPSTWTETERDRFDSFIEWDMKN